MNAVEFTTELSGNSVLNIPLEIAARLPHGGRVRVIVLIEDGPDDPAWRDFGYRQFLREDPPEDAIYDSLH